MKIHKTFFKQTEQEIIVGIDEAGRGPVIGHLVYGLLISPTEKINYDFKDSKQLTPQKREELFQEIQNNFSYSYNTLSPEFLNQKMKNNNLNLLCFEAIFELLNEVFKIYNVKLIYIDTVGTPEKLQSMVEKQFKCKCIVESKADSKYKVVGGASIIAKVIRDNFIKNLNVGSGYPSDPNTIKYLKSVYDPLKGFPSFVRVKWKTLERFFVKRKTKELKGKLKGFFISKE